MKYKLTTTAFALPALLGLVACGGDENASATTPPAGPTIPPLTSPAPTTPTTTATTATVPVVSTTTIAAAWTTDLLAPDAQIAFQADGSVQAAQADGTALWASVTGADGQQEQPDWSPDGSRITFHTDWDTVWVAGADGSDPQTIYHCEAPCVFLQDPAWSPDGGSVAFIVYNAVDDVATGGQILSVDLTSGAVSTLYEDTTGWTSHFYPRFSPDGSSIVFEEDTWASRDPAEENTTAIDLVAVDLATGTRTTLFAGNPGDSLFPDWSPDGSRILFSRNDGNIWLVSTDGSNLEPLTAFDGTSERAFQGTFTADAAAVVFTYEENPGDISSARAAVIAVDGTGFTVIGPDRTVTHPRVRP